MGGGSSIGPGPWRTDEREDCPKVVTLDVQDLVSLGRLDIVCGLTKGTEVFLRCGVPNPNIEVSSTPDPFVPFGILRDPALYHCLSLGRTYEALIDEIDTDEQPPIVRVRVQRVE